MNKRKLLTLALTLCMVAILAIGGTLAYFTAEEEVDNVFTVGSVEIDLIESQYYPQVDTDKTLDDVKADAETYQEEYLAVKGDKVVPGRWVRKAPYVVNTGKSDAYVRIIVSFPDGMADKMSIMMNTTEITNGNIIFEAAADGTSATFTYKDPIKAGEMTKWAPVWQFKLDEDVTSEEAEQFVEKPEIKVVAQAIQAEMFGSAAEAFAAFETQEG